MKGFLNTYFSVPNNHDGWNYYDARNFPGYQQMQEIFEIGHNGSQCTAESLVYHQTGEFSCMNASASRYDPMKQRTIVGRYAY